MPKCNKHNKVWTTCILFRIFSCNIWWYCYSGWLTILVCFVWNPCLSNPVTQHHILHSPLGKIADCVPCSVRIRQFVGDARGIHISGTVSPTDIDHPPGQGSPTSASVMVITILGYRHGDPQRWICVLLETVYILVLFHKRGLQFFLSYPQKRNPWTESQILTCT